MNIENPQNLNQKELETLNALKPPYAFTKMVLNIKNR